jgi:hypothetical protein
MIACGGTGQDGDKLEGEAWPNPRFNDNNDGTVTDNLTGLLWLKNANCFTSDWENALITVKGLSHGTCGLTDNSTAGQWCLPNRKMLMSLIDRSEFNPALQVGNPFLNVQNNIYWSSTTYASDTAKAWFVYVYDGAVDGFSKNIIGNILPVRLGNCIDTTPDVFTFTDQTDFNTDSNITSNTITVSGIDSGANISITSCTSTNCEYSINGGAWTSNAGVVGNGATVTVAQRSSASYSTQTDLTLDIGGVTDTFSVTTIAPPQRTLTVTKAGAGSGTVTGGANCIFNWAGNTGTCTVNDGTAITLSGSADADSTWAGWSNSMGSANGCAGAGDCSFNITADSGVTATFTLNTYTITVTQTAGGIIVCNPTTVNHGSNSNCTITQNADYSINTVTVDGVSQGAIATYQFNNVTDNHTITATYTYNPPPAPEPDPEPQPQPQTINNNDPSIQYGRGWHRRAAGGAYSGAIMQGTNISGSEATASYTFTGSSIQWRAMTYPQGGTARVYIDGQYMRTVNLNSSGTFYDINVFNWSGSNGNHTIKIVPMPSLPGFSVNIDRFIVQ